MNRQAALGIRFLAASAASCLLSACVGNPFADAQVDPRSPIAKEVATSVKADAPYPTFAGIPPAPKDIRPRRQYGVAANQITQSAAKLEQATADSTWSLTDSEAFAAQARQAAGNEPATSAEQAAATEAQAAELRKRATPPPPLKH